MQASILPGRASRAARIVRVLEGARSLPLVEAALFCALVALLGIVGRLELALLALEVAP